MRAAERRAHRQRFPTDIDYKGDRIRDSVGDCTGSSYDVKYVELFSES